MVRVLLDLGVKVDGNDGEEGPRPLHETCRSGKETVARLLIDRGADVDAIDSEGETPLHSALDWESICDVEDKPEVVRLLLDQGAVVDKTTRERKETALHFASARCKKQEIIEMLLDRGANAEAKDCGGLTPLHEACGWGRLKTIQLLLDRNASVNASTGKGRTPLHLVLCNEYEESPEDAKIMAKLLIDRGADVNAKDENGTTPLHVICEMDKKQCSFYRMNPLQIFHLLLDRGADVEAKTNDGLTPMHLVCQKNNMEFVWFFARRYPWLVLDEPCATGDDERKKKRQRLSS